MLETELSKIRRNYLIEYKQNGNKKSLQQLILTYLESIETIIIKFENCKLEHDELLSIAIEGAIKAINNFENIDKIYMLSCKINQNVYRYIESELKKEKQNNYESYEYYQSQRKNGEDNTISYDKTNEIIDKIDIQTTLELLPEKLKRVIELKHGFKTGEPLSFEEIGKIYSLTKESIRKIYNQAEEQIIKIYNYPYYSKQLKNKRK